MFEDVKLMKLGLLQLEKMNKLSDKPIKGISLGFDFMIILKVTSHRLHNA